MAAKASHVMCPPPGRFTKGLYRRRRAERAILMGVRVSECELGEVGVRSKRTVVISDNCKGPSLSVVFRSLWSTVLEEEET